MQAVFRVELTYEIAGVSSGVKKQENKGGNKALLNK